MAEQDSQPEAPQEPDSTRSQPKGEKLIDLHHGKGLKFAEGEQICRSQFTTIVLFAGAAKCGKTTLLASLMLLFQKGPFAHYLFAGSHTLVGFEERNFHVEIVSELSTPTQERTKFTELLHLRVRHDDLNTRIRDVLLCDMSGEEFDGAKDSIDFCKRLGIIRRAERFVLLVDGKKLADFSERNRAKNDAITLLRSCLDANMLGADSTVDVLFTKWDLVQGSESKTEIETFASHVEHSLKSFEKRVCRMNFHRVAAHPHGPGMPLGFGLEPVFQSWLEVPTSSPAFQPKLGIGDVKTEYDRFFWREAIASAGAK